MQKTMNKKINKDFLTKWEFNEECKKEEKKVGVVIYTRLGSLIFQSSKSTIKEAIIEKGDANLRGADLRGANLYDADLRGADLYDADLRGADLYNANLRGANLRGANLRDANLYNANLRGANLYNADLRGANLRGAELNSAKFYGKGGTKKLTKKQLPDFLNALGFQILED